MSASAAHQSQHTARGGPGTPATNLHYWSELYSGNLTKEQTVVSVIVYGLAGVPKLLTYDLKLLVRYGGIFLMFAKGTIFRGDYGISKFFTSQFTTFAAVAVACWFLGDNAIETDGLEELSAFFVRFVPFVLSLYVAVAMQRWWSLRVDALGRVSDAVSSCAMIFASLFPGPEHQWRRDRVVKWGLASIMLLVKTAREQKEIGDLSRKGFLSETEVSLIEQVSIHGRGMVMWGWIIRLAQESLSEASGPPPFSPLFVLITQLCNEARDGIQSIHTFLETQLPFAYVHLLTLLVGLLNIIVTVKCSIKFMAALNAEPYPSIIDMCYELINFLVVPVLFHGLLSISYVIHDPFGEDMLDFPIAAFTEYVAEACDAALLAQSQFPIPVLEQLKSLQELHAPRAEAEHGGNHTHAGIHAVQEPIEGPTIEVNAMIQREIARLSTSLQHLHTAFVAGEKRRLQDTEKLLSTVADKGVHHPNPSVRPTSGEGGGAQ